ncbi:HAMP domain-containing histidine kinase [Sulfurimonas sp. MAG313]|nr:HAMP domain-containing sensor histidine kinase [Sulfurimonas sp. MAG313]MDF1880151.1 HAMP domain-containing histidine kinase [Sulfurimonas sp. MAG313]
MNRLDKYILVFIFMAALSLAAFFAYHANGRFDLWLIMSMTALSGFIIGTGYVRNLIEPLEKRSFELELLSRQTLHELNLPVATILANTQMLLKKENEAKNIKRLERITLAANTLQQMYTELDYTIKKQIHKIDLEVCDLKELVTIKLESYKEIFSQINFVVNLESSSVKIDTIGFLKVLDNLVHNAVKYSQNNSHIKVSLDNLQLSIEDEGIGIEEDFFLEAFEHYYQEKNENSGQGLGLGLVKEYCDRYKIKIYLNSKKDLGTKISLDFKERAYASK